MIGRYLLKHLVQSIIFAILLMFFLKRMTYWDFILYAGAFLAISLLADFIYGRLIDRRIKKELEKYKEKEL